MQVNQNFRKVDQVKILFKRSDYAVLYYGEQENPRYKLFLEVANVNHEVPFVWSQEVNVQWKYKIKKNSFGIIYL